MSSHFSEAPGLPWVSVIFGWLPEPRDARVKPQLHTRMVTSTARRRRYTNYQHVSTSRVTKIKGKSDKVYHGISIQSIKCSRWQQHHRQPKTMRSAPHGIAGDRCLQLQYLEVMQQQGRGVFLAPHRTDLHGRKGWLKGKKYNPWGMKAREHLRHQRDSQTGPHQKETGLDQTNVEFFRRLHSRDLKGEVKLRGQPWEWVIFWHDQDLGGQFTNVKGFQLG